MMGVDATNDDFTPLCDERVIVDISVIDSPATLLMVEQAIVQAFINMMLNPILNPPLTFQKLPPNLLGLSLGPVNSKT